MIKFQTVPMEDSPYVSVLDSIKRTHYKEGRDVVSELVRTSFLQAASHRASIGVDDLIRDCRERFESRYSDAQLASFEGGVNPYIGLTAMLCRTELAWLQDAFFNAQDKPWTLEPTPIPTLPESIQLQLDRAMAQQISDMIVSSGEGKYISDQTERNHTTRLQNTAWQKAYAIARESSNGMQKVIEDIMVEVRWRDTFNNFLLDYAVFPYAVIKGPLYRPIDKYEWDGRKHKKVVKDSFDFENVNIQDLYWSPEARNLQDAEFVIHRTPYTTSGLLQLKNISDVNNDYVDLALLDESRVSLEIADYYTADSAKIDLDALKSMHMVYEFYGHVSGQDLLAYTKQFDEKFTADIDIDRDREKVFKTRQFGNVSLNKVYDVYALVVNGYTLTVRMNDSVTGRRPFHHASSYSRPDSIVGSCIAIEIADTQDTINTLSRTSLYNALMSGGPIIEVNSERFVGKDAPEDILPWSVHTVSYNSQSSGNQAPAINPRVITNVNGAVNAYIAEKWDEAHKIAGIPPYMYGEGSGSPRTLGAFALQYGAATKIIKMMIANIDHGVIEPLITDLYYMIMKYYDDDSIKADAQVRVRGSQGLIAQEQRAARPIELANALAPLMSGLPPERQQPMIERFVAQVLTESGDDPADYGFKELSTANQELQNRVQAGNSPSLDGRSAEAVNVMAGGQLPVS